MSKKIFFICLFVVFLLFCFFRFYNIDSLPIFNDEAIYLNWAKSIRSDFNENKFISLTDGKPFLHYWILSFGLNIKDEPLLSGRIISSIAGILGFLFVCVLSYILFKSFFVCFLSASLYSVLPFLLVYERMVLADIFVTVLGILIFIVSWLFIKKEAFKQNNRFKRFFFFVSIFLLFFIGVCLKQTSFLFFGSVILGVNIFILKKNSIKENNDFKTWFIVNVGTILSFLASYLTSKLIIPEKYQLISNLKAGSFFSLNIISNVLHNIRILFESFGFYITPIVFLLLMWPLFSKNKKNIKLTWLYIWGFLPFIFFTFFAKTLYTRFFLMGVPYLVIIAAYSLKDIIMKFKNKYIIVLIIIISFLLPTIYSLLLLNQPLNFFWTSVDNKNFINFWSSGFAMNNIKTFLNENGKNGQLMFLDIYDLGFPIDYLNFYKNDLPKIKLAQIDSDLIKKINKAKEQEEIKPILLLLNPDRRKEHKYLENLDICQNKKIFYQPMKTSHYTICFID